MSDNRFSDSLKVALVVEDDDMVREITVKILNDAGFEALVAANADQAIKSLEMTEDIGLVVTDINMTGSMDGLRLAHAIRKRWPPVKIIVVSGKVRPSENELPSGTIFVKKPFRSRDLLAAIEALAA